MDLITSLDVGETFIPYEDEDIKQFYRILLANGSTFTTVKFRLNGGPELEVCGGSRFELINNGSENSDLTFITTLYNTMKDLL